MTDDLAFRSAAALADALRAREVTATELLQVHLDRIARLDDQLNAVITIDEAAATHTAAAADRALDRGDTDGRPLLGLPMTIKDALATAGIRSTGGAGALADHIPDHDAEAVAKVRAAGAVIFGKTNLPEWSGDVQAYNDLFGTTNNPWDLTRTPGGSSGGASAAVAAGMSPIEIGTDIGGSIRVPAHSAGICGHKPSYGIVPQRGYISHPTYERSEPDVNVVGPLARTVDDLELILDVIAGPRADLASAWKLDLAPARASATSLRVAAHLDDPHTPVSESTATVLAETCRALEASGVSIDRGAWPDGLAFGDIDDVGLPLISAATSPSRDDAGFDAMRQIVLDPEPHPASMRMRAQASAIFHRDWLLMVERREANRDKWARFFEQFDVLLAPVAITEAIPHMHEGGFYNRRIIVDGTERDYYELVKWTSQFGYVGLPATVVPVGFAASGLPIGIQIVGPHLGDRTTLEFARHVERVLGGYQIPPMAH